MEEEDEASLETCLGRQNVDLGDIEADRQAWSGLPRPCVLEMKI